MNKNFVKKLSSLCLGTVQLGQHYGVNNALGRQPRREESFDILRRALNAGIEYFDTASAYGDAEEILGDFGIGHYPVKIISKLRGGATPNEGAVVEEVKASLERLCMEALYGYMLHDVKDFDNPVIMRGLERAKEQGLIAHIGVSIYEPEDALRTVRDKRVSIIQVPYNVLDQRLDDTEFFELREKNCTEVFARSAFLQGLLLMQPEDVPPKLQKAQPYIRMFRSIAKECHFSVSEAAFLYSYCHPGIDHVVFGVDTVDQLERNLKSLNSVDRFEECYLRLRGAFHDVPRGILVPSLWNL